LFWSGRFSAECQGSECRGAERQGPQGVSADEAIAWGSRACPCGLHPARRFVGLLLGGRRTGARGKGPEHPAVARRWTTPRPAAHGRSGVSRSHDTGPADFVRGHDRDAPAERRDRGCVPREPGGGCRCPPPARGNRDQGRLIDEVRERAAASFKNAAERRSRQRGRPRTVRMANQRERGAGSGPERRRRHLTPQRPAAWDAHRPHTSSARPHGDGVTTRAQAVVAAAFPDSRAKSASWAFGRRRRSRAFGRKQRKARYPTTGRAHAR